MQLTRPVNSPFDTALNIMYPNVYRIFALVILYPCIINYLHLRQTVATPLGS